MKIGILGTRGIPNNYGGFEQFATWLSSGLAKKGHEVWVYNSNKHPYKKTQWNGVHIVHCKDPEERMGTAGQFIYDYNCLLDARKRRFDITLQLGYTSSSIWFFLWPESINVVNMDGMEWKRSKYNILTRAFLKIAERLAVKNADLLIADSINIKNYLQSEYHRNAAYIPYGADLNININDRILKKWDLEPKSYFLVVARMEPENNIEMIIKGFLASDKNHTLVIVSNDNNPFGKYLQKKYPDDQVKFLGTVYEHEEINSLRHYSKFYFHGHSVGGTNPSLLEAMAAECIIAAHDNPFNKYILEDKAYYFSDPAQICAIMNMDHIVEINKEWINDYILKIKTVYNQDKIIEDYESLFISLLKNKTKHEDSIKNNLDISSSTRVI